MADGWFALSEHSATLLAHTRSGHPGDRDTAREAPVDSRVPTGPAAVSADPVDGWRAVSFESVPDDDVDAVFTTGARSIEVEVFCNRGEPTVCDLERNELPDLDD